MDGDSTRTVRTYRGEVVTVRPKAVSQIERDHRDWAAQQPVVTRCLFCPWTFKGSAAEARAAAAKHQEVHAELLAKRKAEHRAAQRAAKRAKLQADRERDRLQRAADEQRRAEDLEEKGGKVSIVQDQRSSRRLLTDELEARLAVLYRDFGWGATSLAKMIWKQQGFGNLNSCGVSINTALKRMGVKIRPKSHRGAPTCTESEATHYLNTGTWPNAHRAVVNPVAVRQTQLDRNGSAKHVDREGLANGLTLISDGIALIARAVRP